MRVTIDSSERLEDVLRVVGALYGVQLRVGSPAEDADGGDPAELPAPTPAPISGRGRGRGRTRGRATAEPAAASGRTTTRTRGSSRPAAKASGAGSPKVKATSSRRSVKAQPGTVAKAAANGRPASASELRDWARSNGFQVSGRGRVSQAIVEAYRAAAG